MKKLAAGLIGVFLGQVALASGTVTGHVVNVRVDQSGKGFVYFDQNLVGSPSCITYPNALAFDSNTAGGKAILARALAAKATGDLVNAIGTGTCTIYSGWGEDWLYGDYP